MSLKSPLHLAIAAAVTLVVTAAAIGVFMDRRVDAYERRAQTAVGFAHAQAQHAAEWRGEALRLRAQGLQRAKLATERGQQVRDRVMAVREVVAPDTCAPFLAARDSVIDEALETAESWREAYQASEQAYITLQASAGALQASHDTLLNVLESRPRPRSRLLPTVGITFGYCSTGEPCAAVGLSWRIF